MVSQAKYHHYIPHFILKTFADNFSLTTPNYIASTSDVYLVADIPDWRPNGSDGPKKKGKKKKKNRVRGEHQIKVYQAKDQTTTLNGADRSYGVEYMYRDIAEDDCMKFETLLSKIECTSSIFIREILSGKDLSLTRAQLAHLKKFLAIMSYRSENRRSQYYDDTFDLMTRKSIYNHMRHKKITRIQDVWFDNLKWLIKTPLEEIVEEYQNALMNLMPMELAPDRRECKPPIHIAELMEFGGACRNYMCIWQAEEGSEFILSEGCFGAWEGDKREPFHTFYVVSPRYCIVLVNRLDLLSVARHLPFRSWFEGDIHAFPETVYTKGSPPLTPDPKFFSMDDVFKYRRIVIPKEDVYFVNSIFLDARMKSLTYKSSASMYKSLRYYDKMKVERTDIFNNGYDYSVLRRELVADMYRTHSS